eukprot:scaffold312908_cov34-Prasinocladus_malaysianus.AAC.1
MVCQVVEELRGHWSSVRPVPLVPTDESPDPGLCLLQKRLQLLNIAIANRKARQARQRLLSPRGIIAQDQAAKGSGPSPLPPPGGLSATNMSLQDSGQTMWTPELQWKHYSTVKDHNEHHVEVRIIVGIVSENLAINPEA